MNLQTWRQRLLRIGCGMAALWAAACSTTAVEQPSITIDVTARGHRVPVTLWGIFFEEINHAGEGGLYAELIQNRDFEANTLPEGWRVEGTNVFTPLGWRTRKWFANDLPGWSFLAESGAEGEIAQQTVAPLNERNPHSLHMTVQKTGSRAGVVNHGFWGMNIQTGEWYDLSFYARTETNKHFALTVSLESEDGRKVCARATIPEVGGEWKQYTLAVQAHDSNPKCRLAITLAEPGTIWFDVVSLFPRKTFKNRPNGMRPDLARMLLDLHPGFLRFPGGCVVEGATVENRIRWKDSIGDIAQRKGDFDLWGYYNTYGLGFHEYLQLAEDLGAEPMYVINAGMSCQVRRPEVIAETNLQAYIQESLDALQYAMGPTNSTWGAQRAANGHPAPFKIKYVEIGNENWGTNYQQHYRIFYDAIKAKYPDIITIADAPPRNPSAAQPQPMEFRDDHYYVNPARFFGMTNYDSADRTGPKIYVGEYAVNRGVGQGNLFGALAEAVFMLNLEKNSDVVTMCSYAPLFENVNHRDWPVNLILFDSAHTVGRSSYQVQKLFSAQRPDFIFPTDVQAPRVSLTNAEVQQLYALAGLDEMHGEVVIKVVNPTPASVSAAINLKGATKSGRVGKAITLGHIDATAENSLDQPDLVVPVESDFNAAGPQFTYNFNPNSLTILRLPAGVR